MLCTVRVHSFSCSIEMVPEYMVRKTAKIKWQMFDKLHSLFNSTTIPMTAIHDFRCNRAAFAMNSTLHQLFDYCLLTIQAFSVCVCNRLRTANSTLVGHLSEFLENEVFISRHFSRLIQLFGRFRSVGTGCVKYNFRFSYFMNRTTARPFPMVNGDT